ncbi:hypothetical protein L6R52_33920 [Myxococcota bacterium]|nr:hypothetical protein [Myxococcota bacterium]
MRSRFARTLSPISIALALAACSSEPRSPGEDSGTPRADAGLVEDAAPGADATEPADGGAVEDAAPSADANVADSGVVRPDAGPAVDGGQRTRARPYFIGHSLVNHDMPAMVQDIARGLGMDHVYDVQVKNGTVLRVAWDEVNPPGEGRAADGEDGRPNTGLRLPGVARNALPTGQFDVVVMTELGPIDNHVTWNCTAAYALEFYNLAVRANPETQVYYYETWGFHTDADYQGFIARSREVIYEYVIDGVNNPSVPPRRPAGNGNCPHPSPPATREPGKPMLMIPAGRGMALLDAAIQAGTVPGITSRSQLFRDQIHLTDLGNYFVALVQYATIYGRDPAGATNAPIGEYQRPFQEVAPATAARLAEIAWEAVRTEPRSGVQ